MPDDLGKNEIVINEWLKTLQIRPEAELQLRYYVIGGAQRLTNAPTRSRQGRCAPYACRVIVG